jgi:hypothetical protein
MNYNPEPEAKVMLEGYTPLEVVCGLLNQLEGLQQKLISLEMANDILFKDQLEKKRSSTQVNRKGI